MKPQFWFLILCLSDSNMLSLNYVFINPWKLSELDLLVLLPGSFLQETLSYSPSTSLKIPSVIPGLDMKYFLFSWDGWAIFLFSDPAQAILCLLGHLTYSPMYCVIVPTYLTGRAYIQLIFMSLPSCKYSSKVLYLTNVWGTMWNFSEYNWKTCLLSERVLFLIIETHMVSKNHFCNKSIHGKYKNKIILLIVKISDIIIMVIL